MLLGRNGAKASGLTPHSRMALLEARYSGVSIVYSMPRRGRLAAIHLGALRAWGGVGVSCHHRGQAGSLGRDSQTETVIPIHGGLCIQLGCVSIQARKVRNIPDPHGNPTTTPHGNPTNNKAILDPPPLCVGTIPLL